MVRFTRASNRNLLKEKSREAGEEKNKKRTCSHKICKKMNLEICKKKRYNNIYK